MTMIVSRIIPPIARNMGHPALASADAPQCNERANLDALRRGVRLGSFDRKICGLSCGYLYGNSGFTGLSGKTLRQSNDGR